MNYTEAVNYVTRECAAGSKYGLERVRELLRLLGNPEKRLRFVHVTGTNGKGSASRMLSAILYNAGYKTGCFTSPFISRINEYMLINNEECTDEEYAAYVGRLKEKADTMEDRPTEFEMSFAMAVLYFAEQNCDMAVIEVGLGGEHDATNVIPSPEVAVFMNIGLDHTGLLGDSLTAISREKSGIIKEGCEVVCYPSSAEAISVIKARADLKKCKMTVAAFDDTTDIGEADRISSEVGLAVYNITTEGSFIDYKGYKKLRLGLPGVFQARNAAVVIEAVEALKRRGCEISEEAVRIALSAVKWPARFEILNREPLIIADGGHNVQCIKAFVETLRQMAENKKVTFIIGVMADKAYMSMFEILKPYASKVIATRPHNSRALDEKTICDIWTDCGMAAVAVSQPDEAVKYAMEQADAEDIICIIGSLYMMGDIRKLFAKKN